MGCWNGTCGITHLPIYSGEKVRLILIARDMQPIMQPDAGYSGSYGLYHPVTIPIPGTYDDYGGVMFEANDPVVRLCLDGIENFVIPDHEGGLQELLQQEGDEAPYVKDLMTNEKVTPGVFMIREGVYQALLAGFNAADLEWDRYYPKPDYREEARQLAQQIVGWSRAAEADADKLSDAHMRLYSILRPFRGEEDGLNKLAQAWEFLPPLVRNGIGALETTLSKIALKNGVTEEDLLPILLAIADFIVLDHMMGLLRRGLVPQGGGGSQDQNLAMHRYLAETTLKEIEVLDRHYEEDEEE